MSEKRIIKLSRTTDNQLMKLANSLGVKVDRVIPKDYSYREVAIQNPRFGHCGQYCVYYLQHNQLDKFFELFKDQYDNF